jgi:hypothetical protein
MTVSTSRRDLSLSSPLFFARAALIYRISKIVGTTIRALHRGRLPWMSFNHLLYHVFQTTTAGGFFEEIEESYKNIKMRGEFAGLLILPNG